MGQIVGRKKVVTRRSFDLLKAGDEEERENDWCHITFIRLYGEEFSCRSNLSVGIPENPPCSFVSSYETLCNCLGTLAFRNDRHREIPCRTLKHQLFVPPCS